MSLGILPGWLANIKANTHLEVACLAVPDEPQLQHLPVLLKHRPQDLGEGRATVSPCDLRGAKRYQDGESVCCALCVR